MQRYLILVLILLSHFFLTACSWNSEAKFSYDLTQEGWAREVETDPLVWTRGTDPWFLSGDANATDVPNPYGLRVPVSMMKVGSQDFSGIKVNGDFKVQIFGTTGENTVYIYGPTEAVNATTAVIRGGTLYLNQRAKVSPYLMHQVIVRIGVRNLNHLTQYGRGMIEGIRLGNGNLSVTSFNRGSIYLAGRMNLQRVENFGPGVINIFGANTPDLVIRTANSGTTNVSGNLGVRLIEHHGSSCINVIGANTRNLCITADGSGKVGVKGVAGLCELKASGTVRVYVCGVSTADLHVVTNERARVGLSGLANHFYVEANHDTCVGARELCADEAYIRTSGRAHVNVSASKKIFATSADSSSIYFFGSPEILTRFVSSNGFVMRICTQNNSCPVVREELVGAG